MGEVVLEVTAGKVLVDGTDVFEGVVAEELVVGELGMLDEGVPEDVIDGVADDKDIERDGVAEDVGLGVFDESGVERLIERDGAELAVPAVEEVDGVLVEEVEGDIHNAIPQYESNIVIDEMIIFNIFGINSPVKRQGLAVLKSFAGYHKTST